MIADALDDESVSNSSNSTRRSSRLRHYLFGDKRESNEILHTPRQSQNAQSNPLQKPSRPANSIPLPPPLPQRVESKPLQRKPRPPKSDPLPRDEEIHSLKTIIDERDFEIQKLKREVIKIQEEKELELRQLRREKDKVIEDKDRDIISKLKELEQIKLNLIDFERHFHRREKQLDDLVKSNQIVTEARKKVQNDYTREIAQTSALKKRLELLQKDYDAYLEKINHLRQFDDSMRAKLEEENDILRKKLTKLESNIQCEAGRAGHGHSRSQLRNCRVGSVGIK